MGKIKARAKAETGHVFTPLTSDRVDIFLGESHIEYNETKLVCVNCGIISWLRSEPRQTK